MPEQIELKIYTASADFSKIDEAIARLEKLHEWQTKVAGMRKIKVGVEISGDEQLDRFLSTADQLGEKLSKLGLGDWAKRIKDGSLSINDAVKGASAEILKLNAAIKETDAKLAELGRRKAISSGQADPFGQSKKIDEAIAFQSAKRDQQMAQMMSAVEARALAEALGGLGDVSIKALSAEEKLASGMKPTIAAMEAQMGTAKEKAKAMKDLAGATDAATKAEDKAGKAIRNTAGLSDEELTRFSNRLAGRKDLLKQKTLMTDEGPQVLSQTFAKGQGLTETVSGDRVTQDLNQLEKFRVKFEEVKAQFAESQRDLLQNGFSRQSPDMVRSLRQQAGAMNKVLGEMTGAGLGNTAMFSKESGRAATLEGRAAILENAELIKRDGERAKHLSVLRKDASSRITEGLREETAALKTRTTVELQAAQTDTERIATLRRLAAEHDALASKIANDVRRTPERERMRQGAAGRAEIMRGEAGVLERGVKEKHFADLREQVSDRISAGLRDETAALQARTTVELRAVQTDRERINVLRQLADEHEKLARAANATGAATPERQRIANQAGAKSFVMRGEADQLERELKAEADRIARLVKDYQAQFDAFGGKRAVKRTTWDRSGGRSQTEESTRELVGTAGLKETMRITRQWAADGSELAPKMEKLDGALRSTGRGVVSLGRTFLSNLGTVTVWSTAVGALYGTLHALESGIASMIAVERQTATLRAVFRGTDEEAVRLRNDVLALAAANGRSADEAVDAAVRWSRLGLTGKEAAEAVRVSLVAANVAEISAADAAEQLSAIYASQKLEVADLALALDQMNSVSNNLNVTVKELLAGIGRTGALAKQAGIPLAELIGIIGAGVATTGRTGAEIGNAVKAVTVALSNPELQKALYGLFRFNVKTQIGDLKDMSTVFAELFVKANQLDRVGRSELLQKIGGKQQASRIEAVLDSYVAGQVRAIKAQQDFGSAEREQVKIRETVISQWETLTTEFQRFFTVIGSGEGGVLESLSQGLWGIGRAIKFINEHPPADPIFKFVTKVRSWGEKKLTGKTFKDWMAGEVPDNPELERQGASANSSAESARLFQTVAKALPGIMERNPEAIPRMINQLGAVAGDGFTEEMQAAYRLGDVSRMLVALEKERAALAEKTAQEKEKEAKLEAERAEALSKGIAVVEQRIKDKSRRHENVDDDRRELDGLLERRAKLTSGVNKSLFDDLQEGADQLSEPAQMMQRFLRDAMAGIGGIFTAMPGVMGTETERVQRQLAANHQQERLLFEQQTRYNVEGGPIDVGQQILNQQDSTRLSREQLERELKAARVKDDFAEGIRRAQRESVPYQVGGNEFERLLNEARGITGNIIPAGLNAAQKGGNQEVAFVQQSAARLSEIQLAAEQRRLSVMKEIVDARRAELVESGKALLFAEREDQLRAALLTKFGQENGPFSAAQFVNLDAKSKQAVQTFTPGLLPQEAQTQRQELEREAAELATQMKELNRLIAEGRGKASGVAPTLPDFGAPGRPAPPQTNLPPLTFTFGKQAEDLARLMEAAVGARMDREIAQMWKAIDRAVSGAGLGKAQSVGASVVNSGG